MPAYKRSRSGTRVSRRRNFRSLRKRVVRRRYTRTKRGRVAPRYSFHRWVTSLTTGVNLTNCTYDTATSILLQTNGVSSCSTAFTFSLNDIPNVSEFISLFDQYLITGVMFQIKMITNPDALYIPSQSTNAALGFYPTIWYAPDHDDSATLTLAQIKEFDKARHKVLYPNRETNIMLRPTTLQQVYRTAATTGYACNFKRSWLDMAQTDIPHYGLKFVIDFEGLTMPATTDQRFQFKINAKFYFKCKNAR